MVLQLNGKIREAIDGFATGQIRTPLHIGVGNSYLVPSESTLGEFYIVSQIQYTNNGQAYRGWICSCPAFRFGMKGDTCKHIVQVEEGLVGAGGETKRWTPGPVTKSPSKSKSKRAASPQPSARSSTPSARGTTKASTGKRKTSQKSASVPSVKTRKNR